MTAARASDEPRGESRLLRACDQAGPAARPAPDLAERYENIVAPLEADPKDYLYCTLIRPQLLARAGVGEMLEPW